MEIAVAALPRVCVDTVAVQGVLKGVHGFGVVAEIEEVVTPVPDKLIPFARTPEVIFVMVSCVVVEKKPIRVAVTALNTRVFGAKPVPTIIMPGTKEPVQAVTISVLGAAAVTVPVALTEATAMLELVPGRMTPAVCTPEGQKKPAAEKP